MKGFGIYVKNKLLEPKHVKTMGVSIWLYLWLLDKMTSISEEGVGKVLGGRPITFQMAEEELGIKHTTYIEWANRLKAAGYLKVKRIPYGLIILVNKAEKIFGNNSLRSRKSDFQKSENGLLIRQYNKDNTVRKKNIIKRKFSSIEEITPKVIDEIAKDYRVPIPFVDSQLEKMKNWLEAKGKVYKNYKAGLRNWVLSEAQKAGYSAMKVDREKNDPEFTQSPEARARAREKIEEIRREKFGESQVA